MDVLVVYLVLSVSVLLRSYDFAGDCIQQAENEDQGTEGPSTGTPEAAAQSYEDCYTLFCLDCCCKGIG